MPGSPPPVLAGFERLARGCFVVVGATAAAVLVTWLARAAHLGTLGLGDIPMAPSTALMLLALAGTALASVSAAGQPPRRVAPEVVPLMLSAAAVLWALIGLRSPLESWLPQPPMPAGAPPTGVMSPVTAVALLMASAALAGRRHQSYPVRQAAALAALGLALLGTSVVSGYILRTPLLYGATVPMAALTGATVVVLGLGLVLSSASDTWPIALVRGRIPNGATAQVPLRGYLLLGLLLVGVIAGTITTYLLHLRTEAYRRASEDLEAAADLRALQVAQWYRERTADANIVRSAIAGPWARGVVTGEDDGGPGRAEVRRWFDAVRDQPQYRLGAIILHDAEAVPRLWASDSASLDWLPDRSALVRQALHTAEPSMEEYTVADGTVRLSFLSRILDAPTSRPIGVLELVLDPNPFLLRVLQAWPFHTTTAETLLLRQRESDVVFLTDRRREYPARRLLRVPLSTPIAATRAVRGDRGPFLSTNHAGIPVLAVSRPVPNTPWTLLVIEDRSVVLAPFRRETLVAALVGTLLAAASAVMVGLAWRQRRLESLAVISLLERGRQESDARLRAAMASTLDAFVVMDRDTRVLDWNERAHELFGWTLDEALGRPFPALALSPESARQFTQDVAAFLRGEDAPSLYSRVSATGRRRDGQSFPVEMATTPLRSDGAIAFSAFVRDVTARVLAEEQAAEASAETQRLLHEAERARLALLNIVDDQRRTAEALRESETSLERRVQERTTQLEAANHELEAFSYSVSHDLRAPLRAVDGYSRILSEDYGPRLDAEGRRLLGVIRSEAQRMGLLIDGLLRFSRLGRVPLDRRRVDMTTLVREVFDSLCRDCAGRMHFTLAPLPDAVGDADVLRQMWANLLGNAIKFTSHRDSATIDIRAELDGDYAVYTVRDNGAGFDMAYADKLFGVFQRLHTQDEFEGTGVGLALVQRIVVRHGGRIWAEGAVGQGAAFHVRLPRATEGVHA